MIAFANLLERLVFTPGRLGKIALLRRYFATQPDPDRGIGLAAVTGELSFTAAKPGLIRELAAARTDPELFAWSYDFVGDLAETVALMWPSTAFNGAPPRLSEVVATLGTAPKGELPRIVAGWLDASDASVRFALLKLITGGLRVGVSGRLAKIALAEMSEASSQPATMRGSSPFGAVPRVATTSDSRGGAPLNAVDGHISATVSARSPTKSYRPGEQLRIGNRGRQLADQSGLGGRERKLAGDGSKADASVGVRLGREKAVAARFYQAPGARNTRRWRRRSCGDGVHAPSDPPPPGLLSAPSPLQGGPGGAAARTRKSNLLLPVSPAAGGASRPRIAAFRPR